MPNSTRTLRFLREPLLHFVVLGAVLFAIDHVVASRADDPHVIVVNADVDDRAVELFKSSRGRDPEKDELYALRRVWLDNEVLYREGLAMQVDRGDDAIRERVIFKALSVVDANLKVPPHDDALLREWFERNRERYDEPARLDFQEAVLVGDVSHAAAGEFAEGLNKGVPGDVKAGLRVFKGRPQNNLVQSYGPDFVTALVKSVPGQWQALKAGDDWRVVRLDAMSPAKRTDYAAMRGVVLHDWTDAVMADQRTAAVRALAKKYDIRYEFQSERQMSAKK